MRNVVAVGMLLVGSVVHAETSLEHIVAVKDVCAWPNLQLLPNGDIVAIVFNQPTHGSWEGGLDCWGSTDGGKTWAKRGIVAPHEPGTNRMNHAAGLAKN